DLWICRATSQSERCQPARRNAAAVECGPEQQNLGAVGKRSDEEETNPRRVNEENEILRRRDSSLLSADALSRRRTLHSRSRRRPAQLASQSINVHSLSFMSPDADSRVAIGVGCPQTHGRHQANYAMEVADLKINALDTRLAS